MANKDMLTLKSINIEWASNVSLEQFKKGLSHYKNQNLEFLYNQIHGIVIVDNGSGDAAPFVQQDEKINPKENGNGFTNTKKNTVNKRKRGGGANINK